MRLSAVVVGAVALGLAAPAFAHHSFAMFDRDKDVTLSGVVKEFEWTNPHVWIHMTVDDQATGKPVVWSFEMQSIQTNATLGWRADSVRPGDKVTVDFHPLKDGSRGGQLVAAVLADGKRLGGPVRQNRPNAQP
jgi:hypothetical protein